MAHVLRWLLVCLAMFYCAEGNEKPLVDQAFSFVGGFINATQGKECVEVFHSIPTNGIVPVWALQMFDSTGKLPSGILAGNVMSLGDYDQCIRIRRDGVRGKYCLSTFKVLNSLSEISTLQGVCLPDVCTLDTVTSLVSAYSSGSFLATEAWCETDEVLIDGSDVFCIVFIVCSVAWIVYATCYDLARRKEMSKDNNQMILAFSMYTNTIQLYKVNNGSNKLSCLYGIRVLSMLWIMYANTVSVMTSIPSTNAVDVINQKYSNNANYIYGASFASDTFFYLSGFMLAHNTLQNGPLNISDVPRFIAHRLVRVFPTIGILYMFVTSIARRMGSGPLYQLGTEVIRQSCVQHWISYLFFSQNYANPQNMCLPHTWYLSADMQLHIAAPLVLIPLAYLTVSHKNCLIKVMFLILTVLSMVIPMGVSFIGKDINIYATHLRATIFLIGIYAGSKAVHMNKHTRKLNKYLNILIWAKTLITMASIAFYARHIVQEPNTTFAILFATFARPIWGVCLTWVILNCISEKCENINRFLSRPIFERLSRLCFAMYVLSYLEAGYFAISARHAIYLDHHYLIQVWISGVFLTMFFGYVWSMFYEIPFVRLEKIIYGHINYINNISDKKCFCNVSLVKREPSEIV